MIFLSRRGALGGLPLAFGMLTEARAATAAPPVVYRSPTCGCCGLWVDHMIRAGYRLRTVMVDDLAAVRRRHGVPDAFASCHTAVIGGYAIEGHIPADDVTALLRRQPEAIGLAVPGMPVGAPGMEQPNGEREAFASILLLPGGRTRTFVQH